MQQSCYSCFLLFFFFSIICVTKAASKFIYIQPQPRHLVHVIRLSVIKIQLFVLKQYSIVCNSLHLVEGELIKNSNNSWFYLHYSNNIVPCTNFTNKKLRSVCNNEKSSANQLIDNSTKTFHWGHMKIKPTFLMS